MTKLAYSCLVASLVCLLYQASFASSFDVSGIRPLAPNGVFSTISANSLMANTAAIALSFEKPTEPDYKRYSLQMAYGLRDDIEISMNVPYVDDQDELSSGFEDLSIGLKHRFIDEGKYGPSVAYLITGSIDTGKEGFSTGGRYGAGLILSKRVGPVQVHTNVNYIIPGDSSLKDEVSLLAGLDFAAGHNFKLLAEILVRKGHFSNDLDEAEARIGYRIASSDNIFTTIALGTDLKDRSPEFRLFATVTVLFPSTKKEIKKIIEEQR